MSKPFCVPGDRTDHGAVMVSASAGGVCEGKGIARVGEWAGCPRQGQGVTPVVSGKPPAGIDGQAIRAPRPAAGLRCGADRQPAPPHRLSRGDDMGAASLKMAGGCLLATAFVWGLVLGWWLSNGHQPTAVDLALHLGALPLALIGMYFLLRGFIYHLKAPRPVALPAGAAIPDQDPVAATRRPGAAAEQGLSLCLLDACMITPGGRSGAALLAAIGSGQRPRPGARLVDDEGSPILVAEVEGLDVATFAGRLRAGLPAQEAWLASDEMLRSLALLDGVLREAIQRLAGLLAEPGPQFRCICLLPAHWDTAHLPWLHSWLQRSYLAGFAPGRCELSLVLAADDMAALRQVDELCLALNREPDAERLVLLASAVSALDRRVVADWAARGQLFSARHPERQVPGECAAALLLASPAAALRLAIDTRAVVQIGRLAAGRRDRAMGAGGRVEGRLIGQLTADLLAAWQLDGAQLTALVSDGDHRAGHLAEALDGLAATGGHLDPLTDCLATSAVVGSASPAGGLVALACAASRALADGAPVLCLGNQHESLRTALLVRPLAVPTPGQPSCT